MKRGLVSSPRDTRQLLIHRHKLVRLRAQVKNGLQHLAMNRGVQKKRKLWSAVGQQALRELPLAAVGRPAAGRSVEVAGHARRAGGLVGPGGESSGGEGCQCATADEPAGRGADYFTGVRADHGRCAAFSPGQAGGELSGTDSARVQLGRTSAASARSASRATGL